MFFGNRKLINRIMYGLAIVVILSMVILTFGSSLFTQNPPTK